MDAFSKRRRIEADGGEIRVSEPSRRSERAEEEEESAAAPAELESCCSVSEAGENGRAGEPSSLISFDQSIASSCCSSSVSEVETKCVDLEGESVIVVDDEDEASSERDRRGSMRREAGGEMKMSKTVGPAEGKRSYLQGGSAAGMPSELELEEFFAAAEKQIQQRFIQKYNYDVVNDVPLSGGRFEWV